MPDDLIRRVIEREHEITALHAAHNALSTVVAYSLGGRRCVGPEDRDLLDKVREICRREAGRLVDERLRDLL